MDILVADDEARGVLAKAMLDAHVPLALPRLHWDGRTARALRSAAGARTRLISRAGAPLPWIPLDDGWADPLARLSSRRRSDLRRAERRARAWHHSVRGPRARRRRGGDRDRGGDAGRGAWLERPVRNCVAPRCSSRLLLSDIRAAGGRAGHLARELPPDRWTGCRHAARRRVRRPVLDLQDRLRRALPPRVARSASHEPHDRMGSAARAVWVRDDGSCRELAATVGGRGAPVRDAALLPTDGTRRACARRGRGSRQRRPDRQGGGSAPSGGHDPKSKARRLGVCSRDRGRSRDARHRCAHPP